MARQQEVLQPPVPRPTPTSQPFWDGLGEGEVRLQQCESCGGWVFYPRSRCPHCMAEALKWRRVSGQATLYTWTRCDRPTAPHFAEQVPMWIAVVELAEGVRMTTNLVVADDVELRAGMAMRPVFEPVADGDRTVTLLKYAPA